MTIKEYIDKAKAELNQMEKHYIENNKKEPEDWPLEMLEGEWTEQELSYRFN